MKHYNIEQVRMLQVLTAQQGYVPIGLAEMSDPDFQQLVSDGILEINDFKCRVHTKALIMVKEFFDSLVKE